MKLLFKYPTRGRPEWFKGTLLRYYAMLGGNHEYRFVITMDEDDETMNNEPMKRFLGEQKNIIYRYGPAAGKIHAINRDIPNDGWDIVVLISDDMTPLLPGFDETIVRDMQTHFPLLDGVLHYWDGYRPKEDPILTWTIMGRSFYEQYGFLYYPAYKGMWCDNELTDVATMWGKIAKCDAEIVKHEWQKNGADSNYKRDNDNFEADRKLYEARKAKGFPLKYSQNDEDSFIRRYYGYKTDGRFLDIGAGDGVTFSNTKILYDMGWRGVAVEASPNFCDTLRQIEDIEVVQAALNERTGPVTLYHSRDFISTTDENHRAKWASCTNYDKIQVDGINWVDLLTKCGTDFDFLNLDIEGENIRMLRQIPKALLERINCACIEYDYDLGAVRTVTEPHGFKVIHTTGENVIVGK